MIEVGELEVVTSFQGIPKEELIWLSKQVNVTNLRPSEVFYEQGDLADSLHIILSGKLQLLRHEAGKEVASFLVETGEVGGLFPFSRMTHHGAKGLALQESKVAELEASLFSELHKHAPGILERLVYQMLDRTRNFTRLGAQREKLISLGTMSAGLAHELNNPASAAKRAAQNLQDTLQAFDEHSSKILSPVIFKTSSPNEDPFEPIYQATTLDGDTLSSLERSDREDELADWLEDHGVDEAWDIAAILVSGGLDKAVMEEVAKNLVPEQIDNFLQWVPRDIEMRLLAQELIHSTARISDLVGAMKAYTYMDQGLEKQEIDVHEGLDNTLIILKHKLKKKSIQIKKAYGDIPPLSAYGSELNQVWTNLLANAIDALEEGGIITIRSVFDSGANVACIDIIDNGKGISPTTLDRIFEPFFTTKGVGEGTGMGLDIANRIVRVRHHGTITASSTPGNTQFRVRLPVS